MNYIFDNPRTDLILSTIFKNYNEQLDHINMLDHFTAVLSNEVPETHREVEAFYLIKQYLYSNYINNFTDSRIDLLGYDVCEAKIFNNLETFFNEYYNQLEQQHMKQYAPVRYI